MEGKKSFFFQPAGNKKWWELRKMDKREYGYTAVVGLLTGIGIGGVIGDVLSLAGLVCGIIWLIQAIKQRLTAKKELR